MRKLPLKEIEMGKIGGTDFPPLKYSSVIPQIIEAKAGGMLTSEVAKCVGVITAVNRGAAVGYALLEDDQWNYLKERIAAHMWPIAHQACLDLAHDIETAEIYDVTKDVGGTAPAKPPRRS